MTFKDAKQQLAAIAAGRYHALHYSEAIASNGQIRSECRVYIDPGISSDTRPTWEEAFQHLDTKLNGTPLAVIEEQSPQEVSA